MTKLILSLVLMTFSLSSLALDYGLDRLNEPAIAAKIQGKTLAVLTHAAARTKTGEHLIDILFKNYHLQKIFAPEHGLRTVADDWVGDGTDEATGLPVISLYKRGTRAPNASDLVGIDAVVIDLQDVGVRYYTYFSTIAEVMKACAASNVEVILLDRPNLLGGLIVEGKVLDLNLAGSFTAYHTVPTRHAMTLGELAQMINAEKAMNVKLTVITASGWKRENLLTNTERPWIAPSPALVELSQVGLYAIWGTLEDFNIAVGRGTNNDEAFKVLGAPWITPAESIKLADDLNKLGFKGATFTPYNWMVTRAEHVGKKAYGVKLEWTGDEIRTDEFTYKVSSLLVNQFKGRINSSAMSPESYGSTTMVNAIRAGTSWETYRKVIDPELEAFKIRRLPYLLY
jgi:uncharacterized protein YbbC (DUF1343 family)